MSDLLASMTDLLARALPYVEEAATDPAHKSEPVRALASEIRAAVEARRGPSGGRPPCGAAARVPEQGDAP